MMLASLLFPFKLAICVFTALLFGHAAIHKLGDFGKFCGILANYRVLPQVLVMPVAGMLASAESVLSGLLLFQYGANQSALAAALLLLLYAAAMYVNLRRGRSYIDCGCGDRSMHQPISRRMVLRNAVIAAVLIVSIWLPAPDVAQGIAPNAAMLPALALGLVCFILYLGNEALAMVSSRPRKRLAPSLARLAWSRFPEDQR